MLKQDNNFRENQFENYLEKRLKPSEVKVFETNLSIDPILTEEFTRFLLNEAENLEISRDEKTVKEYLENRMSERASNLFVALATYVAKWKRYIVWVLDEILTEWKFEDREEFIDAYVSNNLNPIQVRVFELLLIVDSEFKKSYHLFKIVVMVVKKEGAREDDLFFEAIKKLTEQDLKKIIGKGEEYPDVAASMAAAYTSVAGEPTGPVGQEEERMFNVRSDVFPSIGLSSELFADGADYSMTFPTNMDEPEMEESKMAECSPSISKKEVPPVPLRTMKRAAIPNQERPKASIAPKPKFSVAKRAAARPSVEASSMPAPPPPIPTPVKRNKKGRKTVKMTVSISSRSRFMNKWLFMSIGAVAVALIVLVPIGIVSYHKAQTRAVIQEYLAEIKKENIEENIAASEDAVLPLTRENLIADYSSLLKDFDMQKFELMSVEDAKRNFEESKTPEEKSENGTILVLCYVRDNQLKDAESILRNLIKENRENGVNLPLSKDAVNLSKSWKAMLVDINDFENIESEKVPVAVIDEHPDNRMKPNIHQTVGKIHNQGSSDSQTVSPVTKERGNEPAGELGKKMIGTLNKDKS